MESKNDKFKTKNLKHVKIYNELYEMIQDGTYKPGTQLPPETTLSSSMNVSRMTLRKALALLREDGLIKNVPGVGHFVRTPKTANASVSIIENASDEFLMNQVLKHPVHDYCMENLESVELIFRIEPPSKSILDNFGHYTAAVVIVDRWYKHENQTLAYSLSFIPIELIARFQIDLNNQDNLLKFLEYTCYEQCHHCSRCITYSTAGNFTSKKYELSDHDSFLLTQENIYNAEDEILVVSKHYIPSEIFELKMKL